MNINTLSSVPICIHVLTTFLTNEGTVICFIPQIITNIAYLNLMMTTFLLAAYGLTILGGT